MKKLLKLSLICCMMFLWGTVFSQTQMNYWALSPKKVDFTGASPSGSSLPASTPTPYTVSNGVYNEDGSTLFFVRNDSVFTGSGTLVSKLNDRAGSFGKVFADIQSEIAIVPVPGSCQDFYIIYCKWDLNTNNGFGLLYSKITISGSTYTVTANSILLNEYFSQRGSIAVSSYDVITSRRKLFCLGYPSLDEFYITSGGISLNSSIVSVTSTEGNSNELELSHDGDMLAWGNGFTIYTCPTGSPASITSFAVPGAVKGLEFSPDGEDLYISCNWGGSSGLYRIDLTTSPSYTSYSISSSSNYNNTHLELARDGYIYAVNSSNGTLGKIDLSTNTVSASSYTDVQYSNGPGQGGPISYFYKLPDQVDGENYNYFFATPKPVSAFDVNGLTVSPTTAVNTYNCSNITLNSTSANVTQYRLSMYSANSSGSIVSGYSYVPGSFTVATVPSSIDLKALNGNYLASNTGYYLVRLEVKNACSASAIVKDGLIQVSSIASASSNFELNDGTGASSGPIQTLPGYVACRGGISLSGSLSTGYIESYQMKIEEVNCSTGTLGSTLYNGPTQSVPNGDPNNINAVAFNTLTTTGGQFYFIFHPSECFKVTYTVSNACGSSSNWSYFQTRSDCRMGVMTSITSNEGIAPNPFSEQGTFSYTLSAENPVTLKITDLQGMEVATVIDNETRPEGENKETINLAGLPEGIYIYHLMTGDNIKSGKIVKTP